jgi:hypothetical protein
MGVRVTVVRIPNLSKKGSAGDVDGRGVCQVDGDLSSLGLNRLAADDQRKY